ncbi:MAG TPA: hypothetical protein VF384_07210 [Planctomycetota bacterium]
MPTRCETGRQSGSVILGVLFIVMLMAGIAGAMYIRSTSSSKAAARNTTESRLLMTAESGLNVAYGRLQVDALYPVRDAAGFNFASETTQYVGKGERVSVGSTRLEFTLSFQYLQAGVPIEFTSRGNPRESWDLLQVTSRATVAGLERRVATWYRLELGPGFGAAILSDAKTSGAKVGGGKSQAQTGDVVLDDRGRAKQQFVFGGIKANGTAWVDGSGGFRQLTTALAKSELGAFSGEVADRLGGTDLEIPDFTGKINDQLFDFDRFEAAAAAGAGKVYVGLAAFQTAMNAANNAGQPLEGIIVVKTDTKTDFDLDTSRIPGGINVRGCLVFRFKPGVDPLYKIKINTAMSVNAANLASWVPTNEATYTTGYPPVYTLGTRKAWEVDIAPSHDNFTRNGDLPALMYENGVIDVNGPLNVSGAIYGPSFVEVENKTSGQVQYVNGIVIGGAGIYVEGNGNHGNQGFKFAKDCIDQLETYRSRGKVLVRTRFTILK